jgi:drug/metabolite transporter (DMT)-like permease
MVSRSSLAARFEALPRTVSWGVGLAFATAAISGLAIYLNSFAVKQVPDPAVYTTLKNAVAAALLVGLAARAGGGTAARALRPRQWGGLLILGVIGGSIPFLLFFTGLAQASAPSAAFIHKTLFIWVALLAIPFLGERLGWPQIAAFAVLLVGQVIIVPPTGIVWGTGETMIAAATLLWSIEVVIAKRLLSGGVPASVAGAARLGFGLIVRFGYLAATGKLGAIGTLGLTGWAWVLLTGGLLFGYVATWYAALQRAPANVVTSVLVVGAVITAAISALSKGALPDGGLLGGYLLIVAGVAVIALMARRAREVAAQPA